MAEMDAVIYNSFKADLLRGVHNFPDQILYATVHTGYTPDVDNHSVWSDVSATEYPTGAGYVSITGKTVTFLDIVQDSQPTYDLTALKVNNIIWSYLGPLSPAQPSHIIIRNISMSPNKLVMAFEWGPGRQPNGASCSVYWHISVDSLISAIFGFVTWK